MTKRDELLEIIKMAGFQAEAFQERAWAMRWYIDGFDSFDVLYGHATAEAEKLRDYLSSCLRDLYALAAREDDPS